MPVRRILPMLALLAAPGLASAQGLATVTMSAPRQNAVVDGGVVTLGDLFENAGPRAAQALGPAPAPGRRFVVEAPQLSVIARENGLAWVPLAGDERVVVERPGRPLEQSVVEELLRAELGRMGADVGLDIDMPGFQPPLVPASGPEPRLTLEAVDYDAPSRRFAATLVVLADGMATLRQRLSGRIMAMKDVVVATHALRAGTVLSARDLRLQRMPLDRIRPGMAERVEQVVGQKLGRYVPGGGTVPVGELAPVQTLLRDTPVQVQYDSPGLSIVAQGRALEDGSLGATVRVVTLASGTPLMAEVLGPDRVRAIGPASGPRTASARP